MPVSGNRLEFPERSWDTWSQHRLLSAKEVGTGWSFGMYSGGAAWEVEGEGSRQLRRAW